MKLDRTKVREIMQRFADEGNTWCGWTVHGSAERDDHVLITADVPSDWARTMPGGATRQGIATHIIRYGDALRDAGFGTATWLRNGQHYVLIVAVDQVTADEIAPAIRAYLDVQNYACGVVDALRKHFDVDSDAEDEIEAAIHRHAGEPDPDFLVPLTANGWMLRQDRDHQGRVRLARWNGFTPTKADVATVDAVNAELAKLDLEEAARV